MLVKLLANNIASNWNIIKYAAENSLPPIVWEDSDTMNNILQSLLDDRMQCWVSYKKDETIDGVIITTVSDDIASKSKNLLIYCLYAFKETDKDTWIEGWQTLSKYGKSIGCQRMIAYTDEPKMVNITWKLGGEARYTFCTLPIE